MPLGPHFQDTDLPQDIAFYLGCVEFEGHSESYLLCTEGQRQ